MCQFGRELYLIRLFLQIRRIDEILETVYVTHIGVVSRNLHKFRNPIFQW